MKCTGCDCEEGQYHKYGCPREKCPFCGDQLSTCMCCYRELGILKEKVYGKRKRTWLPKRVYENGLTPEEEERWFKILKEKGRIRALHYPILCSRCGKTRPEIFLVSNMEWKKYIEPSKRKSVLCKPCYDEIKEATDRAKESEHREKIDFSVFKSRESQKVLDDSWKKQCGEMMNDPEVIKSRKLRMGC